MAKKSQQDSLRYFEAVKYCKERGYQISAVWFRNIAKRFGLEVIDDRGKTRIDRPSLDKYIKKATSPAPAGYASIKDLAKEYKLGLARVYIIINQNSLSKEFIGPGRGTLHVKRKDFERCYKRYRAYHKK